MLDKKNKMKFLFIVTLTIALIIIPSLLLINQRNIEISIDEKNTNEGNFPQPLRESSVYYEDTYGLAFGVYVSGDYAYIADTNSLAIIDISDPTNPETPIYEATDGIAWGVYVSGDYAYVATGWTGLAVIDISDPTHPGMPVYEATSGWAYDVHVSGDYAYVAAGVLGLAIINISDPTDPGAPVYEYTNGEACGVYVSGDYAYMADGDSGLAVIDISDPTDPGTPVYEDTNGFAEDIYVRDDYAYVADAYEGLAVIDISEPNNPGIPVYENTSGNTRGVYVSGDYAYLGANYFGLAVIDISDPTNPGTPVYEDTNGYAEDVYVRGDYVYVADVFTGLVVIEIPIIGDTEDPIITNAPSDFTVESSYKGVNISWIATDLNPNTYTIELQGSGIIEGPSGWSSGVAITYNVPDGLAVGEYIYTINFTDDYNNFVTDTITMTIQDTEDPIITNAPSDFTVKPGCIGAIISWTATDPNPNTYTIELQGFGMIVGPSGWSSGVAITYYVPSDLVVGEYIYTINFTDDYDHFVTDTITVTVQDTEAEIPFGNFYLIFLVIGIISLVIGQKRRKLSISD